MMARSAKSDHAPDGSPPIERIVRQHRALAQMLAALNASLPLLETLDVLLAALATGIRLERAALSLTSLTPTTFIWPPLLAAAAQPPFPATAVWALDIPLRHEEHHFGALQLTRARAMADFDAHERDFINAIARQMVVLCERGRRDEEAHRNSQRAEALREIGRALSAELDFDRFLTATREQVARIIEHDSSWLAIWDEAHDTLDMRFYMADGERLPEMEVRLPRGKGLGWALIDERRTLNAPDYIAECQRRGLRPTGRGEEPRLTTNPWLGVPLLIGGRLVGAVAVQRTDIPFEDEEAAIFEVLAGQIAAALENARRYAEAQRLASADPLTGLVNHRAIHERLDAELWRAARQQHPLAVIMADLNNFKCFNDTYGHPVGDRVLRLVAEALRAEARGTDIVGRYGGDEFLIVLSGGDENAAAAYIERVRARVDALDPQLDGPCAVPLALTAGVALYPRDARGPHELIAHADRALYARKQGAHWRALVANLDNDAANSRASLEIIDGLLAAVDAQDGYTLAHSALVADTALLLAEALALSDEEQKLLLLAARLHDVGKISLPGHLLRKAGALDDEEQRLVRQHVEFSATILRGVPGLQGALAPILTHHERWDGYGYPLGLCGADVPLLGRILAIADAYGAMVLDRPYRAGLSLPERLSQLRLGAGTQFDPALVTRLCAALGEPHPDALSYAS